MGWLDLSNVSNILRQSYVNGFLDVSRTLIVRGDASMNGNLFVAGNLNSVTPSSNDNSTRVATTEFVKNQSYSTISYVDSSLNNLRTYTDTSLNAKVGIDYVDSSLNTLRTYTDTSLNVKVGIDYVDSSLNDLRTYTDTSLNVKATIASPTFTGIVTIPTAIVTTLNATGDS